MAYGWDYPNPFTIDIRVSAADIDGLGHVNNAIYVTWLERIAWAHSEFLGIDLERFQALDRAMAVARHEIDYLAAARLDDDLLLGTWVAGSDRRLKLKRHFQLVRPADDRTLLRANTLFVCIEPSSGRPRRMPELFTTTYGAVLVANPDPM